MVFIIVKLVYLGLNLGLLLLLLGATNVSAIVDGGSMGQRALGSQKPMRVLAPSTDLMEGINYDLTTTNYVCMHNFQVNIKGIDVINTEFCSISGVVSESEEINLMHGTDPYTRKSPGRVTHEPIVLERVYKGIDDFYGWYLEVENGNIERRDVTITMMDSAFRAIRAITLDKAWPSKWEMPDIETASSGPAIERITLICERVRESAP
jgi:phage tail-like protein